MTAKHRTPTEPKAMKPQTGEALSSETPEGRARLATFPEVNAAVVIEAFSVFGNQDAGKLTVDLRESTDAIVKGDTARVERMLMAQAHALDSLFATLTRRAALNIGEYMTAAETYLKLGLRAQSQCRATLETLAQIKNPAPVAFVRQANIANGPQQVNNGEAVSLARAEQTGNRQTELSRLANDNGQSLGFGATAQTIQSDPSLEAVAALHRTKDG